MLYNYLEVIPFMLFVPVALNIILPLGMLAVYLATKLIVAGLKPILGSAVSRSKIPAAAKANALDKKSGLAVLRSAHGPASQR